MMNEAVNRVAGSALISIDFDEHIDSSERATFDLAEGLFQGVILKEKDFREFIKTCDWSQYAGKNVNVFCSADAIIPSWAFMLVATRLQPIARLVVLGQEEALEHALIDQAIETILQQNLTEAKVVIKGCGDIKSRDYAYFQLAVRLTPIVGSMMYGEPCSTVPVFKRKKL